MKLATIYSFREEVVKGIKKVFEIPTGLARFTESGKIYLIMGDKPNCTIYIPPPKEKDITLD